MPRLDGWREQARQLRVETYSLYLAYKDPQVPWYAKVSAACVVAYAFSPIDLIPDFIPVLGYLDDLVLVPLGIALALKMIPPPVLERCRMKARENLRQDKPANRWGIIIVIAIWLIFVAIMVTIGLRIIK